MSRYLPFIFLASVLCVFSITLIIWYVNPDTARWYLFALVIALVFAASWGLAGTGLFFLRTRFYKRYSSKWYFETSFKMAFFAALFMAFIAALGVLKLISTFNLFLAIVAVSLFALWSYLGKSKG